MLSPSLMCQWKLLFKEDKLPLEPDFSSVMRTLFFPIRAGNISASFYPEGVGPVCQLEIGNNIYLVGGRDERRLKEYWKAKRKKKKKTLKAAGRLKPSSCQDA